MFLDSDIPSSLTCRVLDNTEAHQELKTCIDAVLKYISKNKGLAVVGWYKQKEIVDISKDSKVKKLVQVNAISIKPTHSIVHGEILNERKYRITNLQVVEGEE